MGLRGGRQGVSVELLPVRGGRQSAPAELLPVCGGGQGVSVELLSGGVGRLDGAVRSFGW